MQAHLKATQADAQPKLLKELAYLQSEKENIKDLKQYRINRTGYNRSVYVIAFPYRENLLAKEDR